MKSKRHILFKMLISMLTLAILLAIGEVILRCIRLIDPPLIVADNALGWKINDNLRRERTWKQLDGRKYDVVYETGKNGFRFWGDPLSRKKKVLVVGDSYTEARQVSNSNAYFAILAHEHPDDIELFTYGAGGYGTLQEYMIMRNYWDTIKPDIVIWQWCINDLCNNSFYMDTRTSWNFNVIPRPFLENGTIRIRCPREVPILSWHSALWRAALPRLFLRFLANMPSPVDTNDLNAPFLKDAITTTDRILSMADAMFAGVPVYVFTVGQEPGYLAAFRNLAQKHGYRMIETEAELERARKNGIVVDAHPSYGGHWCEEGHRMVSELLDKALMEDGQIRNSKRNAPQVKAPDNR